MVTTIVRMMWGVAVSFSVLAGNLEAQCSGNACASIQVSHLPGGPCSCGAAPCYQAANKGSRNVQVAFRPYAGIASRISKVLGPNEVWTPQLAFDGCMNGYVGNYEASYAGNAKQGKAEMLFGPVAMPRDTTAPLSGTTLWNGQPGQENAGAGKYCTATRRGAAGLVRQEGCAGEWTTCVATIHDPANQNMMVVRGATAAEDAMRRAKECRNDVTQVTCYSSAILACAPYIACGAP